ncbi:MAG: FlgD immunoglobulin-like domain containing protein, partial [Victivallales bacterium]
MKKTVLACFAMALAFAFGCNFASLFGLAPNLTPDEDMLVVSDAASPRVAYAVFKKGNYLNAAVSVESFEPLGPDKIPAIGVKLGLAADKAIVLTEKDAAVRKSGNSLVYEFRVPSEKLIAGNEGWEKFRMGISVDWPGGPFGQSRQRETFLQDKNTKATHGGLSPSREDWQLLNLNEFEKAVADRKLQIAFDFKQPVEGKASIVIEDEKGNRVRNLVSGKAMPKGMQRIVWDATNERGELMPPGKYQWRAISHPGLKPEYLFSFCDGAGSNHGTQHSAATNGKFLFFGTSVSEGGYELVQLDLNGKFVRGYNSPMGHGLAKVAVAADEKFLYAAYDGTGWTQKVDRNKADWKAENKITLVRVDLGSGNFVDYKKERFAVIASYWVGPGSPEKMSDRTALSGMALLNGHLYIGDSVKNVILDIDPATGTVVGTFPLVNPVALAAGGGKLYAVAGRSLLEIDPANGKTVGNISTALEGIPNGLAVGPDGKFYVSDAQSHVVRIFDNKGKQTGMIGKPGGVTYGSAETRAKMGGYGEEGQEKPVTAGPYDPLRLYNPAGLVLSPDGHLWVTENDRWKPKRLAAYDPVKGTMWKEFFGPTNYGASGCGFDPDDSSLWFGQGTLFKLDFKEKKATPVSTLGGEEGMHYRFWRQDGRTFVIACGKVTYIEELLPGNTLKPLAFLSSGHQYAYAHSWKPGKEFEDAFRRDYPNVKYEHGKSGQPNHGYGMLWVDKNGDGNMQTEEIEFSMAAESLAGSGWGHDFNDLTIRVPAKVAGKSVLVSLKPAGWWPGGAPKYPPLNDAVKAAIPINGPSWSGLETTVDRFGNMIINSDPEMRAFSPESRLLWGYPN